MDIGKMGIKRESGAISMVMESIWVSVTSDSDMVKVCTFSKMVVAMRDSGRKASVKGGVSISMLTARSTQVSISRVSVKVKACMNTSTKKFIRELGKKIRKMAMA